MNDGNEPDIFVQVGLLTRLRLLLGRPRRLFDNLFRKRKVERNLARRVGQCNHCGACCRMGIRCRLLTYDGDGKSSCDAYGNRLSANCRNFPMSEKDLAERDLICTQPCGYRFVDPDQDRASSRETPLEQHRAAQHAPPFAARRPRRGRRTRCHLIAEMKSQRGTHPRGRGG